MEQGSLWIRTRGNPPASRPSPALIVASLTVVVGAAILPFTPLGRAFGFVPPPAAFYLILAGLVAVYLVLVQVVKTWFYRLHPAWR